MEEKIQDFDDKSRVKERKLMKWRKHEKKDEKKKKELDDKNRIQ